MTTDARSSRHFPDTRDEWASATPAVALSKAGTQTLSIFGFQVMQDWERPLMRTMALGACSGARRVLEVGYGLGICAGYIQHLCPAEHIIIEANRGVAARARRRFRRRIDSGHIQVVEGFWQDVLSNGEVRGKFDAIVFDTFPLRSRELRRNHFPFFKVAARLLKRKGRFTYFTDEAESLSRQHQARLQQDFDRPTIQLRSVKVEPPAECEYWASSTLLCVVVRKEGRT